MKPGVIAKRGDKVTCPNGHVLYRVKKALVRHTAIRAADFKSAHDGMSDPDPAGSMQPCCDCGAEWWRSGVDGVRFQLHFSDGWRPHAPPENPDPKAG